MNELWGHYRAHFNAHQCDPLFPLPFVDGRAIGSRGLLVIKDVTSLLAMNRDARGVVLAALREIHDGRWERNVGTDGGRTLSWQGRIAIVGAVTTAWDRAHDVIASMGDRFVVLRMDSTVGRIHAGRQAIGNTGREEMMRAELSAVAAGVLARVSQHAAITVTAASPAACAVYSPVREMTARRWFRTLCEVLLLDPSRRGDCRIG